MDDRKYQELLEAILDLRGAAELGFEGVNRRFDGVYQRLDGLDRRFGALESRLDRGFGDVAVALNGIRDRLTTVEQ